MIFCFFFFFKQKTAYEMRISDWSSDVCSSDLGGDAEAVVEIARRIPQFFDEAAVIEKTLHLDDEDIGQVGGDDAHGDCPPVPGCYSRSLPSRRMRQIGRAHV